MPIGRVLRIVIGVLLILGGLWMFLLIGAGSHGNYQFRLRRWDDWLMWGMVILPILGGTFLLLRKGR